MHENRETSETPAAKPDSRSASEGPGRTARVYVCEESHRGVSYNPSHPDQVVGVFSQADAALADRAVHCADEAFKTWSRTPVQKRVDLLLKTSKILLERKYYYEARLVYEVGKTWPEADADVAEAIDFIEFYARAMLRLAGPQPLTPVAGREEPPALHSPRRGHCDSTLELPPGDSGGNDRGFDRDRQHGGDEALQ